jgi:hypothetical protein
MDGGRTRPIDAQRVDDLCLSCHDGKKAWAEPHPIRRDMAAAGMKAPAGWPLLNGRIGCLTCHDVIRHCDPSAHRPTANPAFVREYEPSNALAFCTKCHAARDDWRVSPHRQLAADGSADMHTCVFCHTEAPELQNRRRSHEPRLHTAGSDLCLTCHSRHWDVSPLGHVERSMTDAIRRTMLMREGVDPNSDAQPEILPLTDNKVTCYTCHNPHQEGLFPSGARLGARSREPGDAYAAVRVPQSELCLHCHSK